MIATYWFFHRRSSTHLFNTHFNRLSPTEQQKVTDLMHVDLNMFPENPETLKTFLYISEYLINNNPSLAPTIRQNRIYAYQKLEAAGLSNVRDENWYYPPQVSRIKSQALNVDWQSRQSLLLLTYQPIAYTRFEAFGEPEIKETICLAPQLVDITNLAQTNFVFDDFSWRLNSTIGYQDAILTNQSFEIGKAFSLVTTWLVYMLGGIQYANFNSISHEKLNYLGIYPSLLVGASISINPSQLYTELDFQYRFGQPYLSWRSYLNSNPFVYQIGFAQSAHQRYLQLGASLLF